MALSEEVKKICWEYCYLTQNGKVNKNYLKKVEESLEELNIKTEQEAKKHFRNWHKKNKSKTTKAETTKAVRYEDKTIPEDQMTKLNFIHLKDENNEHSLAFTYKNGLELLPYENLKEIYDLIGKTLENEKGYNKAKANYDKQADELDLSYRKLIEMGAIPN